MGGDISQALQKASGYIRARCRADILSLLTVFLGCERNRLQLTTPEATLRVHALALTL